MPDDDTVQFKYSRGLAIIRFLLTQEEIKFLYTLSLAYTILLQSEYLVHPCELDPLIEMSTLIALHAFE